MSKLPGANLEFVREDDFVEYYIFPKLTAIENNEEQLRQQLAQIQTDCMNFVQLKITERSYIWHKDEYQLQARTGSEQERLLNDEITTQQDGNQDVSTELPPHLHGVTHFGENIEDEWFIVYLLTELSRTRPDYIVRVCDADGEFLLIEAADALPDWASNQTCQGRVFLVNGSLQLIQDSSTNSNGKPISMAHAVQRIRMNPTLYRCSRDIQSCIDTRTRSFQHSKTHISIHHQVVQLPQSAAVLLKQRPALIASAVRAFCERDSLDTKALRTMRYFPPESTRVRTNVAFTRCLYAMLLHTEYTPERKIGWQLADPSNSETHKEQLLGIKIASGLEILAVQAKRLDDQLEQTPAWRAYLRSLQGKGFFKENIEGSAEYQRLIELAKEYYKNNQARFRTAPLVGAEILELLLQANESSAELLRDEQNNLQPSDAEDWLYISAEDLDAMLLERYGPKKIYNLNGEVSAKEFTKHITEFLEQESNFEGIEPHADDAEELDSDDDEPEPPTASSTSNAAQSKEQSAAKIKKNSSMRKACQRNSLLGASEEQDSTHVRNFLDFVIPEDNWDSTSEMSDYADEDDLERNFDALTSGGPGFSLDRSIKAYMEQMDRELAQTTMGKSFQGKAAAESRASNRSAEDDDFDDIEDFEPININVNTLKNMMDSYKSQLGGAGPASNLLNAMGVGMSAATDKAEAQPKDISESSV